jgi:hypothetical protein
MVTHLVSYIERSESLFHNEPTTVIKSVLTPFIAIDQKVPLWSMYRIEAVARQLFLHGLSSCVQNQWLDWTLAYGNSANCDQFSRNLDEMPCKKEELSCYSYLLSMGLPRNPTGSSAVITSFCYWISLVWLLVPGSFFFSLGFVWFRTGSNTRLLGGTRYVSG